MHELQYALFAEMAEVGGKDASIKKSELRTITWW